MSIKRIFAKEEPPTYLWSLLKLKKVFGLTWFKGITYGKQNLILYKYKSFALLCMLPTEYFCIITGEKQFFIIKEKQIIIGYNNSICLRYFMMWGVQHVLPLGVSIMKRLHEVQV